MTTNVLSVAIYTDGMGTWQARCLSCPWRGSWRRSEDRAVDDAKGHKHDLPDPDSEDALSFDEVEAAGLDGTNRFGPQA
jgi:hypothetical protein